MSTSSESQDTKSPLTPRRQTSSPRVGPMPATERDVATDSSAQALPRNEPLNAKSVASDDAMQALLRRAIELNNSGIVLLGRGDYAKACRALGRGLKIVQRVMASRIRASSSSSSSSSAFSRRCCSFRVELVDEEPLSLASFCFSSSSSFSAPHPDARLCRTNDDSRSDKHIDTAASIEARHEGEDAEGGEEKFVYTRCVRIRVVDDDTSTPLSRVGVDASRAIIFNLAVAHHAQAAAAAASHERRHDSKCLSTASRMYELAYRMETREADGHPVRTMAMLNNLGHLHEHLRGDAVRADRHWRHLLSLLMYMSDGCTSGPCRGGGSGSSASCRFMSNVCHLMLSGSLTAVAA